MTVCIYLNGGVPIVITDALQSTSDGITLSPENSDFIRCPGSVKSLKSNFNRVLPSINSYPLVRKWKVYPDDVCIAFAGRLDQIIKFDREFGGFIENSSGSGDVVEKLQILQSTPSTPKFSYIVVAPTSETFYGGASKKSSEFWPFDAGYAVGSGSSFIHFMYERWLQTLVGTPVHMGDRYNFIHMAMAFVDWLNCSETTSSPTRMLRRYRQTGGSSFGGLFHGIYYSPEDSKWYNLHGRNPKNFVRLSKDKGSGEWFVRKIVRTTLAEGGAAVQVATTSARDKVSSWETFYISNPFEEEEKFDIPTLNLRESIGYAGVDSLRVVKNRGGDLGFLGDRKVGISSQLKVVLDAETEAIGNRWAASLWRDGW